MPDTVLIMTATILPPAGATGLTRADPLVRMNDYLEAMNFYIDQLGRVIDRILFVDNSDYDCTPLRDLAVRRGVANKVDILSYYGLDWPPYFGRCYGEMLLLEHAMKLPLVQAMPEDTVFWKVTGRYKLLNIATMVRTKPKHAMLYADLRGGKTPWFDMRSMAWTKRGFAATLTGFYEDIRDDQNDNRPGEETAYRKIGARLGSVPVHLRWVREPMIDGKRAFDSKNWNHGRRRLVFYMRDFQRLFLRRVLI